MPVKLMSVYSLAVYPSLLINRGRITSKMIVWCMECAMHSIVRSAESVCEMNRWLPVYRSLWDWYDLHGCPIEIDNLIPFSSLLLSQSRTKGAKSQKVQECFNFFFKLENSVLISSTLCYFVAHENELKRYGEKKAKKSVGSWDIMKHRESN